MPRVWDPEQGYTQELYRFEQRPSVITATMQASGKAGFSDINGGRPFKFVPFPRMMYKARRKNGDLLCIDPQDEQWSAQNYITVNDESEMSRAVEMGWRPSQAEAFEFTKSREQATRVEAAHRAYDDRNMSEMAKREIAEAEANANGQHVTEIKEKPKRKYTRKPVAQAS